MALAGQGIRWYGGNEFPSLSGLGNTLEKALREIKFVVEAVLEEMDAEELPEPLSRRQYSGKLKLRMPAHLHRSLAEKAVREDSSLNSLITSILAGALSEVWSGGRNPERGRDGRPGTTSVRFR